MAEKLINQQQGEQKNEQLQTGLPKKNVFLLKNPENADYNQYWYSDKTIQFIVNQIVKHGQIVCFLSTPSVYFTIDKIQELGEIKKNSIVFDFDKKFDKLAPNNFLFYDFNKPEEIPQKYHKHFDFILVDPPFITKDVWSKYQKTINLIIKDQGKLLLSSIDENFDMLKELLPGLKKCLYKPLIPNLVYQYNFYSNYNDDILDGTINQEVGF